MPDLPPPPAKKRGCLVPALLGLLVVALTVAGIWFWFNRPIKPVRLDSQEKAAVQAKLEAAQQPARPAYEKGAKEIILTERELNGLLNENTNLGDKLKFELVNGAVHARYETDLDKDLPVLGGILLKARARFLIANDPAGRPQLVLDDLTAWGISVPNDWLGGLKGHDLLKDALGTSSGGLAGVEEMRVEDGRIRIRLKE